MNPLKTPLRASVSTWALHPLLGTVAPGRPGQPDARLMATREGSLDLLDVPEQLAAHGFHTMELCHFHLPETSAGYLEELKGRLEAHGIELWSLLIDDGDISDPAHGDRDHDWVAEWIDRASLLGARCARVIAGKQLPTDEALARSVVQLRALSLEGYVRGVRILTENWYDLLSAPEHVAFVMEGCGGAVGLNFDFGNWTGPDKYGRLAEIAGWAEGSHAKCGFAEGAPDTADFRTCLQVTQTAGFCGPYTLVHGEPDDVWGSLEVQRTLLEPFLTAAR